MKYYLKNFNYVVDIDVVEILNDKDFIIKKIKHIFINRCYDNSYILDIVQILERSYIDMSNKTCHVKIQAKCLDISKYDIFANNEIVSVNNNKIICKNQYFVSVIKNKNYELNVGDILPLIIGDINFMVNKNVFTVSASLMIPYNISETDIFYNITDTLKKSERDELDNFIINYIEPEIQQLNKQKRYNYFKSLLYKYKTKKTIKNTIDFMPMDASGIVSILNELDPIDHNLVLFKSSKTSKKSNVDDNLVLGSQDNPIDITAYNFYKQSLETYYKYITSLFDLCVIFNDDEKFNNSQHVFQIYENNKF